VGLSYEGCKEYLKNFKEVKILLHDQFKNNEVLELVYDFIELEKPKNYKMIFSNKNDYIMPRNMAINLVISKIKLYFFNFKVISKNKNSRFYKLLKRLYRNINNLNKKASVSTLEKSQIDMLYNFYKDDIEKLSELIKVDLKHWVSK
jgi:hypothetical protein